MELTTINSIKQAQSILQSADGNALVVFDLDDTLIAPTDAFHIYWKMALGNPEKDFIQDDVDFVQQFQHHFKIPLINKNNVSLDAIYGAQVTSKILSKSDFKPVEPCTLQVLKDLQMRGIKCIALTYQKTGQNGEIPCMQEWRAQKLLSVGIDFGQSFRDQEFIFDAFTEPDGGCPPMFYNGILMTALKPKGPILSAFLDRIKYVPSKVIFFDDTKVQVESVAQAMALRNIPFHGYWYQGAKTTKPQALNRDIVQLQLNHLKQYNDVLSTEEARALLQQRA